jgi:hypothetical protein
MPSLASRTTGEICMGDTPGRGGKRKGRGQKEGVKEEELDR